MLMQTLSQEPPRGKRPGRCGSRLNLIQHVLRSLRRSDPCSFAEPLPPLVTMSLKAKIEAVIYAAEEPVTLQQLASLLGGEAQAELDYLAAAQRTLPLDPSLPSDPIPLPSEPELLNEEVLDIDELLLEAELDAAPADSGVANREVGTPGIAGELGDTSPEPPSPSRDATPAAAQHASPSPAEPRDEKQLAREGRERERAVREYFRRLLDQLIGDYATADRGLEIREVAGGFRLATKPEYHDAVRGFAKSLKPPLKLTLQALETLAIVAYKQPITAPEVSEIRGVDSGGVLGSLMARKLVTPAGRKQVIGRPILYKTTKDFLLRFGLKDIGELPSIEEFEKMAGELAESDLLQTDVVQEEMPMPNQGNQSQEAITDANLREEEDAAEPQADGDSTPVEAMPIDGRLSGVSSASEETDSVDTSAEEATIQNDEAAERREGKA